MTRPSEPGPERFREKERREKRHEGQLPGIDDEPLPPAVDPIKADSKPRRNDPCPCGSGKKYKQCCGKQAT